MILDSLPSNKSKQIQAGNFGTRVSALLATTVESEAIFLLSSSHAYLQQCCNSPWK